MTEALRLLLSAIRAPRDVKFTLHNGDCLDVLRTMPENSVDSIVTDPPYGLSFMGKKWDYDVPSEAIWRECLRVLKPGGHLLAFAGTRTQHRMAVRIEDAGFEIRDMIAWVYASGFPKSLDVSKAIDKGEDYKLQSAYRRAFVQAVEEAGLKLPGNSRHDWTVAEHAPGGKWWAEFERWLPSLSDDDRERIDRIVVGKGLKPTPTFYTANIGEEAASNRYDITAPATDAARQWQGWGTALKPALEPITVARKPLAGTVAENVLQWGCGGLNIDGCRVGDEGGTSKAGMPTGAPTLNAYGDGLNTARFGAPVDGLGRWPANLIHDGSGDVLAGFPEGNSRFFYCAKASKKDRDEYLDGFAERQLRTTYDKRVRDSNGGDSGYARRNQHPTVKPTDLMRYLARLVTPPGGLVLDPFMGSGSTGKAAMLEGFRFIGIERDEQYMGIARARIGGAL